MPHRAKTHRRRRAGANPTAVAFARGLGVFSVALGAAELLASRQVSRAVGLRGSESLVAGYGLREIATGLGILVSRDPTPWIWGRVGGDVLDIATLTSQLDRRDSRRQRAFAALATVAAVTVADVICVRALSRDVGSRKGDALETFDYGDRSGFSRSTEQMRGVARKDFRAPKDMRIPQALRPYTTANP